MTEPTKATYRKLPDDGASWKCAGCNTSGLSRDEVLFTTTPDGKKGTYCLECLDEDWIANATQLPDLK